MDNTDLLQIKIEQAKNKLSEDTVNAINSVDWRKSIAEMVNNRGYTIEQLGVLELETELLLCGLTSPANYPRELQGRMGIGKTQVNELLKEMDERVFHKIKERLIEITERKRVAFNKGVKSPASTDSSPLEKAGINILNGNGGTSETSDKPAETREEILKKIEKPEPASFTLHPILTQKLSGPMQMSASKTVHSLDNITRPESSEQVAPNAAAAGQKKDYTLDPYREKPE